MTTQNPPSTGAGYADIEINYGASMPGSGAGQQQHSYHQQVATLGTTLNIGRPPGPFPPHQLNYYASSSHGQAHLVPSEQQLDDFNEHQRQVLSQQQQVHNQQHVFNHPQQPFNHPQQPFNHPQQVFNHPQQPFKQQPSQPIEQIRTSPINQQELLRVDGEGGYGSPSPNDIIMKDAINDSEQSGEMMKQSAAMGMDTVQPSVVAGHGGNASKNSTAKAYHREHEQGSSRNSRPLGGVYSTHDSSFPRSQSPKETRRKPQGAGIWMGVASAIGSVMGIGTRDNSDELQYDAEKFQNREQMRRAAEMESKNSKEALRRKDDELRKKEDELRKKDDELRRARDDQQSDKSRIAKLKAELEGIKTRYDSEVDNLMAKITNYKATAEKLNEQLSSLEQSNSKQVGGTGAHKDSHAIPPNLVKSATFVTQTAFACTKAFIIFLKEWNALESHVAWQNVHKGQDERYRKHAVEAYICTRLFAGFENESYVDSLDCFLGSQHLPVNYEESEFFLQTQDLELRQKKYLHDYDSVKDLGLQKIMNLLKTNNADSGAPFFQFCCRKLVRIMDGIDGFFKEFPPSADYSDEHFLLHRLAKNPVYCDKLLKPFVNLAMAAFLMHRLAFQFNPPARIFRYARGMAFDKTYMENAVPMDDDDSDEELVVGLMLVPGFQVGATIVKCIVYLVPRSPVTAHGSDHTNH